MLYNRCDPCRAFKYIHEAQKYGDVVVGVMTDKALVQFDRFPTISFYERKKWCQEITGVSEVVEQVQLCMIRSLGK